MKNIIIANWKCNPNSLKEAKKLYSDIVKNAKAKNTEVVVCAPFVYLSQLKGDNLGAQNVCMEEKGAFTGEVSVNMLKDIGVQYVILGHSERRKYFGENNIDINKKIKLCLQNNLTPILCIGETKQEFDLHQKPDVLETQLTEALKDIVKEGVEKIIVAYEPVWAIGTGENCSVQETLNSINFIKKIISELYDKKMSENVRVIYGGSVKSFNSGEYIKSGGVNGFLVGGASLDANEFSLIAKSAG